MTNIDHEHWKLRRFDDLQQAFVDFAKAPPAGRWSRVSTIRICRHPAGSAPGRTALDAKADVSWDRSSSDLLGIRHGAGHGSCAPRAGTHNERAGGRRRRPRAGPAVRRIAAGLAEFRGAERRFEVKGEPNGILVVDDYGHHPTETAAVLAAAKTLKRRIVIAFQPHGLETAADDAFGPSFKGRPHHLRHLQRGRDEVPGVTIEALADAVRRSTSAPVDVIKNVGDLARALAKIARRGDVVLTLGAGSIGSVGATLVDELAKESA
jgi:UDP-N-acetylmuramate--alanine ligase